MSIHVVERFLLDRVHEVTSGASRASGYSFDGRRPSLTMSRSGKGSSSSGGSDGSQTGSISKSSPKSSPKLGTYLMEVVEITGEAHLRRVRDGAGREKNEKGRANNPRRKSGLGDVGGMVFFKTSTASHL